MKLFEQQMRMGEISNGLLMEDDYFNDDGTPYQYEAPEGWDYVEDLGMEAELWLDENTDTFYRVPMHIERDFSEFNLESPYEEPEGWEYLDSIDCETEIWRDAAGQEQSIPIQYIRNFSEAEAQD